MAIAGSLSKEKYLLGNTKRNKFKPHFELTVVFFFRSLPFAV